MLHYETWYSRSPEAACNGELLVRTFPESLQKIIWTTSPLKIYGYMDAYGNEVYDITGVWERNLYSAREVELFFVGVERDLNDGD